MHLLSLPRSGRVRPMVNKPKEDTAYLILSIFLHLVCILPLNSSGLNLQGYPGDLLNVCIILSLFRSSVVYHR